MIKRKSYILTYLVVFAMLLFTAAFATVKEWVQHDLKLVVQVPPGPHAADAIYVAGNFNNWSPGQERYKLTKTGDRYEIEIKGLLEDNYEFKFTRGTWESVACAKGGTDVSNTRISLKSDTTIYCSIEAWKDDYGPSVRRHTASPNVHILDSAFYIPQLDVYRRVSIYLPPKYKTSRLRYPVIYLQDGQNVFDDYTANFGEWGVDETLDSMIAAGRRAAIVVAVDNGPKRLQEYNPFYFEKFGDGQGDAYADFLAKTLKPYIDSNYRTLQDKRNSIVAGSSMGGLIAYYTLLKYPAIFGKAGVFSPAFWTAEQIKPYTDSLASKVNGKLFFYMGKQEGQQYMDDMMEVAERLGARSATMIYTAVDEEGRHNEAAWRKWFGEFYNWIIADGYNYIIKTKD